MEHRGLQFNVDIHSELVWPAVMLQIVLRCTLTILSSRMCSAMNIPLPMLEGGEGEMVREGERWGREGRPTSIMVVLLTTLGKLKVTNTMSC